MWSGKGECLFKYSNVHFPVASEKENIQTNKHNLMKTNKIYIYIVARQLEGYYKFQVCQVCFWWLRGTKFRLLEDSGIYIYYVYTNSLPVKDHYLKNSPLEMLIIP